MSLSKAVAVQTPSLNLFDIPSTDYSQVEARYLPINPFTTGIHSIDFQINPQEYFIHMSKSYFEAQLQMKVNNSGNIVDASQVAVLKKLIHSLFKHINVRLNGTLICPQTDSYNHKAFIYTRDS